MSDLPPESTLNVALFEKVIERIETIPESYLQALYAKTYLYESDSDRPEPPCGTMACIAGEAIICAAPSVQEGIAKLLACADPAELAQNLLGLDTERAERLFAGGPMAYWPAPHGWNYCEAKTYEGKAKVAVALLREVVATDGKVLDR